MIRNHNEKVKPCPMCGGTRIMSDYPKVNVIYSVNIFCADCGLKGFKNFTQDVDVEEGFNRVREYWNTRSGK